MSKKQKQKKEEQTVAALEEEKKISCHDCEDYKAGWMRAQADYQNLQKQVSEQRGEWAKMSEIQILEEFIPIYQNFKTAFRYEVKEEHAGWENWKKGIGFIMKQFEDVLKFHEVEEIETVGNMFDPTQHEVLGEEISAEYGEGIIIREVVSGYLAHGKVLQVAKVIVAKKE